MCPKAPKYIWLHTPSVPISSWESILSGIVFLTFSMRSISTCQSERHQMAIAIIISSICFYPHLTHVILHIFPWLNLLSPCSQENASKKADCLWGMKQQIEFLHERLKFMIRYSVKCWFEISSSQLFPSFLYSRNIFGNIFRVTHFTEVSFYVLFSMCIGKLSHNRNHSGFFMIQEIKNSRLYSRSINTRRSIQIDSFQKLLMSWFLCLNLAGDDSMRNVGDNDAPLDSYQFPDSGWCHFYRGIPI